MKQTGLLPQDFDFDSFIKSVSTEGKKTDISKLLFQLRKSHPEWAGFLAEQIKIYSKAKEKLPVSTGHYCLFTSKSYEQASSESIALFKSRRFKGNSLLDLTGGLGVDDWAFAGSFKHIISVDNDELLNEIARYNFNKLGIKNIERLDDDAYDFIKESGRFDLIYIDADRRSGTGGKKSVTLHDSEPSILKIIDRLFELSGHVLLKLSPLIDITYISKTLKYIKNISVISLKNEVKEISVLLVNNYDGKITIEAVDISDTGRETCFSFARQENRTHEYDADGKYFYEPAHALIKSGLVPDYASKIDLHMIAANSLYLTGNKLIDDFFGRTFEVVSGIDFSKSKVKKYLAEQKITKANISKRNFLLKPDEIIKLFKLRDGGEDYLFFTQDTNKNELMYHCRKIR